MADDNDGITTGRGGALAWVRRRRISIPDAFPGYYARPALVERLMPTNHRVGLLKAPGGFGKTALLGECCRMLVARGIPVAWLSVEDDDDRAGFEAWLVLAFRHAGVDTHDGDGSAAGHPGNGLVDRLLAVLDGLDGPCVVALDDLQRLADSGAVNTLNALVRKAPPNLHMIFACRELPPGLDIAEALSARGGAMLSADELRFSKPEIAAFFDLRLSRQQLAQVSRESVGWPIALHFYRTERAHGTRGAAQVFHEVLRNWMESRLWGELSKEDRDFLLDIGLFDRLDLELLDEVIEGGDVRQRLRSLPGLAGLIDVAAGAERDSAQLHPLVREYCEKRRFRETPARFRSIHRRAAESLERRGETMLAMRHAARAGDRNLVGKILEDAGGLRLWLLQGPPSIGPTESLLTSDVVERRPRLALALCVLLLLNDRIGEAKQVFDAAAARTEGFTRNPTGDDRDIRIDHCLTQGMMFVVGCSTVSSPHFVQAISDLFQLAQDDELEPAMRGALDLGLCVFENQRANFDGCVDRAERSRQFVSDGRSPYLEMQLDFQLGSAAMAQGRVKDAESWYASGLRVAKTRYPDDASALLLGDVLTRELELERNRLPQAVGVGLRTRDSFERPGNVFATYQAESAIVTELTEHALGVDMALGMISEMREYARRTDRPALVRYLSSLRVASLTAAGRVGEAERTWRMEGLPTDDEDCLSLMDKNWRQMEALGCARVRLFVAREAFEPARRFSRRLLATAADRRLIRTTMRVLAASMVLEHVAGNGAAAAAHMVAFLRLYRITDYARPVAREGMIGYALLDRVLDANPDRAVRAAAADLREVIGSAGEPDAAVASLTARELDVLRRLPEQRDKQIAAELGITFDGVRYHVRRIFAKLGARGRRDAVHRARSVGLLPPES